MKLYSLVLFISLFIFQVALNGRQRSGLTVWENCQPLLPNYKMEAI